MWGGTLILSCIHRIGHYLGFNIFNFNTFFYLFIYLFIFFFLGGGGVRKMNIF